MARDHHLFDHQPHDGLLGLEIRVVEPRPELLDDGVDVGDLPGRQLLTGHSSASPGRLGEGTRVVVQIGHNYCMFLTADYWACMGESFDMHTVLRGREDD
jgi:hypothetical protein